MDTVPRMGSYTTVSHLTCMSLPSLQERCRPAFDSIDALRAAASRGKTLLIAQ
jgi:hypothetical protein